MHPHCPFCSSTEYKESYLPDTFFNEKLFHYVECINCKLIYVTPFPTQEDYIAMYPPSYQSGVNWDISSDKKLPGLRFTYKKHFNLIKRFNYYCQCYIECNIFNTINFNLIFLIF